MFTRSGNSSVSSISHWKNTSKVQQRGVQVQHLFQDAVQAIIGRLPAVIKNAGIDGFCLGERWEKSGIFIDHLPANHGF